VSADPCASVAVVNARVVHCCCAGQLLHTPEAARSPEGAFAWRGCGSTRRAVLRPCLALPGRGAHGLDAGKPFLPATGWRDARLGPDSGPPRLQAVSLAGACVNGRYPQENRSRWLHGRADDAAWSRLEAAESRASTALVPDLAGGPCVRCPTGNRFDVCVAWLARYDPLDSFARRAWCCGPPPCATMVLALQP